MAVTRRDLWSAERWERIAPLSGVIAVVLFVIGLIVHESADRPDTNGPAEAFVRYFQKEDGAILGGTFLIILGLLSFLWFAGSLRALLAASEGGATRLSAIAFGAGVATVVLIMAGVSFDISGVFATGDDGQIDPGAAQALGVGGDGVFYAGFFTSGVLLIATGILALRTAALPAWAGWVSLVLGVALLVPWVNWFVWLFLFPLWIILLSVWMWRPFSLPGRGPRATAPPPSAA